MGKHIEEQVISFSKLELPEYIHSRVALVIISKLNTVWLIMKILADA